MGMKKGSGNLSFGEDDDEEEESASSVEADEGQSGDSGREASARGDSDVDSSEPPAAPAEYPYFVRRSGVMDGRDTRIELHLRSIIAEQEAEYRQDLADELDVDQVSKTDAREFALKVAYENPGLVADLMREEGFDALN